MHNTSRSERNQLRVPTHHQTDVCICTLVVMCDIIHLVDYCLLCYQNKRIHRRPNSHQQSAHICHYQSDPTQSVGMQIKCQTYKPSTRGSSHHRQAATAPLRSTNWTPPPPLTQLPISLLLDSAQN